jgi:hypothetical protein
MAKIPGQDFSHSASTLRKRYRSGEKKPLRLGDLFPVYIPLLMQLGYIKFSPWQKIKGFFRRIWARYQYRRRQREMLRALKKKYTPAPRSSGHQNYIRKPEKRRQHR